MSRVRAVAFAIETSATDLEFRTGGTEGFQPDQVTDGVDEAALAKVYETYAPVVYARCRRILNSTSAAHDATQETFARLLAHNKKLLPGNGCLFYLFKVSTNICLNILREQRVREHAIPELASRATLTRSPERGHADRQFAAALLKRCDETSAAIAIMHYIDGMTQVEVAEVLSISRKTVFNRLRKLEAVADDLLTSVKSEKGRAR
jgi:RNA polymerase sigma-70 factor, ECF subfamily